MGQGDQLVEDGPVGAGRSELRGRPPAADPDDEAAVGGGDRPVAGPADEDAGGPIEEGLRQRVEPVDVEAVLLREGAAEAAVGLGTAVGSRPDEPVEPVAFARHLVRGDPEAGDPGVAARRR